MLDMQHAWSKIWDKLAVSYLISKLHIHVSTIRMSSSLNYLKMGCSSKITSEVVQRNKKCALLINGKCNIALIFWDKWSFKESHY